MENVNVKTRNISLKSYKCFEEVPLNCAKDDNSVYQWTVLLGNNNTGKITSMATASPGIPLKPACPILSVAIVLPRILKTRGL